MRFGGPVFRKFTNPEEWVAAVKEKGFTAAYCPVEPDADPRTIEAYRAAAQTAGIVIAEVGAWWVSPLSSDAAKAKEAMARCTKALDLAEAIDARCCVNVSGSRSDKWDGPSAMDLTERTFDDIVSAVRAIIDAVKPARTFYVLEPMPWMYPDSTESYARLLRAVDRRAFAVHFDPVNMINCPSRYFHNGAFIRDFFRALGPHIRSCHAKDIILGQELTVHLDECIPGQGTLDYAVYLECLNALTDRDVCLMTEHLTNEKDYDTAAAAIRAVARKQGIAI